MRRFEQLEPRCVLNVAPLLIEGFSSSDYSAGGVLVGAAPIVSGFDAAWSGSGTARLEAGSLEYSGFGEAGGNRVNLESSMVVDRLLARGAGDPLANYIDADGNVGTSINGEPLYFSFLMQVTGSSPPAATFSLYDNGTSSSNREFRILYSDGNATFHAIAGPNGSAANLESLNNSVNLFVVRIDFQNGDDIISIWQNPDAGSSEPASSVQITTYDIAFDRIAFSRFSGVGTAEFDEVRFGDTWTAVTTANALDLLPQPPISADGFGAGYIAGSSVDAVNSFIEGFDGPWSTMGNNSIGSGDLFYPGVGSAGSNHLQLNATDVVSRSFLAGNQSSLANYLDAEGKVSDSANGSPLYLSFLMQVEGTSAPSATFSLYDAGVQSTDREFRILYSPSNSSFQGIAGSAGTPVDLGGLNSAVNLFVIRIDFLAGSDVISIWHNPTAGGEETAPDVQIADYDIAFDRLAFTRFSGVGSVRFDELRIADQWFGVTASQSLALRPGPKSLFAMQGMPPPPLGNGLYPNGFFPFIDQFGQYRHQEWEGKIHNLEELIQAGLDEAADLASHPGPSDFDQYGGWLTGPLLEATGFFRTEKVEGKWWLVDPEGRLFFSNGITGVSDADREGGTQVAVKTGVSGREDYFSHLPQSGDPAAEFLTTETATVTSGDYQGDRPVTVNFFAANSLTKYGENWEATSQDRAHDRLRSWGMNTIAAWSDEEVYLQGRTPYTMVLFPANPSLINAKSKFPDYFDPAYQTNLENRLLQETGKSLNDPWNVGYFVNNEVDWTRSTLTDDTEVGLEALAAVATQHAKIEFRDQLIQKYGAISNLNSQWRTSYASWHDFLIRQDVTPDVTHAGDDLVAFDASYAEQFFRINQETIDDVAGNHLYLGSRFTGSVRLAAAQAAMAHADVVSINRYGPDISVLPAGLEGDVPLISGEYHFSADDTGLFGEGLKTANNQSDRAEKFSTYLLSALASDRYVGVHWLQYWDYPSAGKINSRNNNSNLGFVSIADQPYSEMVDAARAIGESLYATRFGGEYTTLPGDYNRDRTVDSADYQTWKQYYGSSNPTADGDGDGQVNAVDYAVWRSNLGASLPPLEPVVHADSTDEIPGASSMGAEAAAVWPFMLRQPAAEESHKPAVTPSSPEVVAPQPLQFEVRKDFVRRLSHTQIASEVSLDEAFASRLADETFEMDPEFFSFLEWRTAL